MAPAKETAAVDDWDAHWTSYGDSAEDNPAQRYRRRLVFAGLGPLPSRARLVDIGSGQGDLLAETRRRFPDAELLGLEQSAQGIEQGRRKVADGCFVERDLLQTAATPADLEGWATHATCSEVLEHVDDPATLLRHAADFLAPGCRVVITVPGGPRSAYDRHIGHRRHFDRNALRDVIEAAGFDVVRIRRAGFPVFNLYKLLVIARGKRLIEDVSTNGAPVASGAARIAMTGFRALFPLALPDSPWGWQLIAVATPRPS